jgi:Putative peptidoglycan binding domain
MSAPGSVSTQQVAGFSTASSDRDRQPVSHRRRWWLVAAAVVATTAAVVVATDPFATNGRSKGGVTDNAFHISLATVTRRDMASQTEVNATLGYAGSYNAVNQARGTITWLPSVGQVIGHGEVLYRIDGKPVVLLYGPTPAYRDLGEGASASDVTGPDVAELNAELVALGYATAAQIPAGSDQFSWWTKQAVKKLQAHLGITQNGTLSLGQVVFLPGAARITTTPATLGSPAGPGQAVLTATSITRQVTINLDAAQQAEVKAGDKVTITLPDNRATAGVVSSVGTVAAAPAGGGSNSTPTITVLVSPTDPAATGTWDQAPVLVSITTATVKDVLAVPVNALMALSGGGYAVEVADPGGLHHLVDVTLGLFDDASGLVQVSGLALAAGQHVVVPAK